MSNNALFDSLKKNEEGEAQDSFEGKSIKASLKEAERGSLEYDLLKKSMTWPKKNQLSIKRLRPKSKS